MSKSREAFTEAEERAELEATNESEPPAADMPIAPKPGDGWILLSPGEKIRDGDQAAYSYDVEWETLKKSVGSPYTNPSGDFFVRRRIAPSAPASPTEPGWWWAQFKNRNGSLWGLEIVRVIVSRDDYAVERMGRSGVFNMDDFSMRAPVSTCPTA